MSKLDEAFTNFNAERVRGHMYKRDLALGVDVHYEPEGVMTLKVGHPGPTSEARFTSDGITIRQDRSWKPSLPEDNTLELFRLLDPRTFQQIASRAQESSILSGEFHLSFHLYEVIEAFGRITNNIRENKLPRTYQMGDTSHPVPTEIREWATNLVQQPRHLTFYAVRDTDS